MLSVACIPAVAQETKADKAVRIVKELCLTGTQFDLKIDASGNLGFKKLTPSAAGSFSVNVRDSKGAAAIVDDKIRQIADEDIRNCIKPHITRIIDAVLDDKPAPSPKAAPLSEAKIFEESTRVQAEQVFLSLQSSTDPKCVSARLSLEPSFAYWKASHSKPTVWPALGGDAADEQLRQRIVESANSQRRLAQTTKNQAIDLGCTAAGSTKDVLSSSR